MQGRYGSVRAKVNKASTVASTSPAETPKSKSVASD